MALSQLVSVTDGQHKGYVARVSTSPELPAGLSDRLGFLLGRAHQAHRAIAAAELAPLGLGVKGFGALSVLAREGPMSQQQLGARQGIDRTTMVTVIDDLEHKALVQRRRDPANRRAYALQATPKGRRLLERAEGTVARAEEEFLAPLSLTDRRRLKARLRELISPGR